MAAQGWLAVTRDSAIQRHRAEMNSVRDNGLRMVALSGPQARGTWEQLELLLIQWRRIETLQALPGPFCYVATRTTLRAVDL